MTPRLSAALAAVTMVLGTACVTSIPVKIRRAPELNLVGVQTLEIKPFDVSGNLDIDVGNTGKGLLGAVADVALDAGVNKLGERKHKDLQRHHVQGLKGVIVHDGYYKVADKGAKDGVLSGSVLYEVSDSGESGEVVEKVDGKDQTRKVYTLTRRAKVTVRIQVVDKDGEVLGATDLGAEVQDQVVADNRDHARDEIEAWDSLVRKAIDVTQQPTLKTIAPYFVTETRTLAKGDNDVIKEANKTAARGEWKTAAQMWTDAGRSGTGDDRTACAYNLGVYAEVEGRLDDALKQFEEAKASSGGSKFSADIARVQTRIREEEQIRAARIGDKTAGT